MIANPNDGNSPRVEVATPMIDVSAGGLITATTEQEKGYVSGGTKSATQQLTTQGAATITPGTTAQTAVASGRYTTGDVVVSGDANLVPENIAEGVSIFGVTGAHAGGSGDREQIYVQVKGNTFAPISYIVVSNGTLIFESTKQAKEITADINSIMLFGIVGRAPSIRPAQQDVKITHLGELTAVGSVIYACLMANGDIEVIG